MGLLRDLVVESWTSSSPARAWLRVGLWLWLGVAVLCLALDLSRVYGLVAAGVAVVLAFLDVPLSRRDKRLGRISERRWGDPPPEGWPTESTIQRLRKRRR